MIKELETKKILLKVEVTYGKASDLKKLTDGSIPTMPTIKSKNPNEALNDIIKPIDTSTIDSNYNYADSLTTIGSIMSSITNNVGSGAAA